MLFCSHKLGLLLCIHKLGVVFFIRKLDVLSVFISGCVVCIHKPGVLLCIHKRCGVCQGKGGATVGLHSQVPRAQGAMENNACS